MLQNLIRLSSKHKVVVVEDSTR